LRKPGGFVGESKTFLLKQLHLSGITKE